MPKRLASKQSKNGLKGRDQEEERLAEESRKQAEQERLERKRQEEERLAEESRKQAEQERLERERQEEREDLPMRLANMENKNRWKEREMKRPVEGGWGMNFCIASQGTWQHVQT